MMQRTTASLLTRSTSSSTTGTSFRAVLLVVLLLACRTTTTLVSADKDDSYYMAGQGNPNVDSRMYWKDADNVLQDLSKFKALYVQYSHCAWTWCKMADADNDVDENDYWYMGKIPPMGANVAYSLYGQLKSDNSFSGCNADTFINSFYTNKGFQDFAASMYAAEKTSAFSKYTYSHADDDGSYSGPPYDATCGGGYGVGCDVTYGFAVHTYSTDICNPEDVSGVQDSLSSLNSALAKATCVKIYDSSSYSKYGGNYGNNDDDDDDGGGNYNYNNDDDGSYSYGSTALALLSRSSACFYQNFYSPDGNCPDPYGKIAGYRQNFANGLEKQRAAEPYEIYVSGKGRGMTLLGMGIAFLMGAIALAAYEVYLSVKYPFRTLKTQTAQHDGLIKTLSGADHSQMTAGDDSNGTPKLLSAPSHDSIRPTSPPSSSSWWSRMVGGGSGNNNDKKTAPSKQQQQQKRIMSAPSHDGSIFSIHSSPSWWARNVGRTDSMEEAEDALAATMGKKAAISRQKARAQSKTKTIPEGDAVFHDRRNTTNGHGDDDYDDPGFLMWMVQKATGSQKSAKKPSAPSSSGGGGGGGTTHYEPHAAAVAPAAPRAPTPEPEVQAAAAAPAPPSSPTPLYTGAQTVAQSVQETTAPLYTSVSQSVQDTVNYRMSVFNYNVGRVRDSISSILPSSEPSTSTPTAPAANDTSLEMARQGQLQVQPTRPVPSNLTDGDLSQLTECTGERVTHKETSTDASGAAAPNTTAAPAATPAATPAAEPEPLDPFAPPSLTRSKEGLEGLGGVDEVGAIRATMEHDDGAQLASEEEEEDIVLPNRDSVDALEVPNNSSSMDSSARMDRMLDRAFNNALRDDTAATDDGDGPNIPETIISSPSDADQSDNTSVGKQLMKPPSGVRK